MLSIFSEKKTPLGGFDYGIVTKLLGAPGYIDELSLFLNTDPEVKPRLFWEKSRRGGAIRQTIAGQREKSC